MATALTTTNPENLTYKYEQIHFAILGGIRLDGLDRLRVTIKIEFKQQAIRHNLDLYNDTQVEKLIRKTAERLEIGSSYMSKAVGELINELENYRLQAIANSEKATEKRKELTPEEKQEAISFLQSKDLLQKTNDYIGKAGVVGEELNRLLMYIIFTSRKTYRPLHIVSFGSSGVGKSHLQEKVGELIPQEDKIEITSLTGNAFYYFDKDELGHKLILIEDLDGVLAALYPIRELQSKQKISKTVTIKDKKGNAKTIHLVVYGPVSIAGCTTQERIYEDNANRSFLIYLDESEAQDERIMDYQRAVSAGKIDYQTQQSAAELLRNSQRLLQPIKVINPYAEYLKLPKEVFKPRRTNAHYIAFIEAITFYKQYQRESKVDTQTGEEYIETTFEDIQEANTLMREVLIRKSDELNNACRRYFEYLKAYLKSEKKTRFTTKEVREALKTKHGNQKRYMTQLIENNYIKKEQQKDRSYQYEVVSYEEYEQLKERINSVLDESLHTLQKNLSKEKGVQSSSTVQSKNEPLESTPIKAKSKKTTQVHEK